jgi:hypothetical protein
MSIRMAAHRSILRASVAVEYFFYALEVRSLLCDS